jgi:hypothetical protein
MTKDHLSKALPDDPSVSFGVNLTAVWSGALRSSPTDHVIMSLCVAAPAFHLPLSDIKIAFATPPDARAFEGHAGFHRVPERWGF